MRTEGVEFRIRGGSYIRFNLRLEGEEIPANSILLGANGQHPGANPFALRR